MGLPPELFEEAGTTIGTLGAMLIQFLALQKAPEEARKSEQMQGHLRQSMGLAQKDLALALEMAREAGLALPVAGLVNQLVARVYSVEDEGLR
jgi:3-hydroxyisobutyrate dehydrogenase-like beta-hydroxyacid dehydrogenase